MPAKRIQPTARQIDIRDHESLSLLITAPAGCGKTEALALRVRGFLDRQASLPPRRILLVTFTNRAKENIDERLRTHLSTAEMARHITIHNLHGLSARIIAAHGNTIGLDDSWQLPDADWVGQKLGKLGLQYKQKQLINGYLQEAKLTTRTDAEVIEYLTGIGHQPTLKIEQERQASKQLTYDDLPRLADLILRSDQVAELYREHFSCVIVDEFQDLTLQQLSIIQRIGAGRITFAGDLAQGIYGFAGAAPERVLESARAEGVSEITFAESHRSSPAVLDLVNSLVPLTGGVELECSAPASWPGGGLAAHRVADSTADEADWVITFAQTLFGQVPQHRIGVLVRAKNRREALEAKLSETTSFAWYRWDDPIFDSRVAPLLRTALRKITQEQLNSPDIEENIFSYVDPLELQDPANRQGLAEGSLWVQELFQDGISKPEIIQRIRVGENETLLGAPGLHLVTGHSGKGQQFDWVIVLGLEKDSIPSFHAKTAAALTEEARVLSVMISRARHGVVVTQVRTVDKPWGPSPAEPSLFQPTLEQSPSYRTWGGAREWLNTSNWQAIGER